MSTVEELVVNALREGTTGEYKWEVASDPDMDSGYNPDRWILSMSVAPYDSENHVPWFMIDPTDHDKVFGEGASIAWMNELLEEGTPTHVARVVDRTRNHGNSLELVDGTELYLIVDPDSGTVSSIWEEVWQSEQPDFYGGYIKDAREWVNELPGTTGECYYRLECPFE